MDFYKSIAKYYDYIFPLNNNKLNFLRNAFHKNGNILDIACATGIYTNALQDVYNISGFDLNPEMITIARERYAKINFDVSNMLCLTKENIYDGIYCIGNSLVHLQNIDEIEKAIDKMYKALKTDGVVVIQIINYDRILNKEIKSLPTIHNYGLKFIRNYQIFGEKIAFNTVLELNNKIIENTMLLYPLGYDVFIKILKRVGFNQIEAFDGFSFQPFNIDESIALVVKATKK